MENNVDPDQMAFLNRIYPGSAGKGLETYFKRTRKTIEWRVPSLIWLNPHPLYVCHTLCL